MKYILTSYEDKIMPSKYSCFLFTFLSPKNYLNKICFFYLVVSLFGSLSVIFPIYQINCNYVKMEKK